MMPFRKGQSGNPGGRVGVPAEVRNLARRHSKEAIEWLIYWIKSEDGRISLAAASALLDRGLGRPAQLIDLSVDVMSRRIRELSDDELMLLEQRLLTMARPSDANQVG
jgi:HEAT repeat protein